MSWNSFINNHSWQCLLGPMSKNVNVSGNIAHWTVNKKKHFTNLNDFDQQDISFLKLYGPSNFHYITENNLNFLKDNFKISKSKLKSTLIDLENLNYNGRKYHGIRGAINKNKKLNLTIQDNFNNIKDVEDMVEIWSNDYTKHYFRDYSGKNTYFFKNNWHQNCHNIFIYAKDKLIAFAVLSPTEHSSYIIGKALFKDFPGLTEYLDDLAYQKATNNGIKLVNLGQSKGNIAKYKNKFPNTSEILHFDGNIQ